jgi:hypothetical protein
MIEAINQLDRFEQGFINVFFVNTRIIIWLVSCHNEICT